MILHVHSDVSFLCETNAKSRLSGFIFLSDQSADPTKSPTQQPKLNGPLHVKFRLLCLIMVPSTESNIWDIFHSCQTSVILRIILQEFGHPQFPSLI